MALTFTTGMTVDDTAQAATNWGFVPFSGTADGSGLDTTLGAMGPNSMAYAMWTASAKYAIMYDYFTSHASVALNLSTVGNEVLALWFAVATPAIPALMSAGGIFIIASSSTDVGATVPTAYRTWYVSGSDIIKVRQGVKSIFFLAMIDTRKAASVADVGAFSLTSVHRFGIGVNNSATIPVPGGSPAPNGFWCGGAMHGRPSYQVIGDGTTTATWTDLLTHSATTQQNGLIEDEGGGVYRVSCGLRIGSTTQGATTTFVDATGKRMLFKRQTYYNVSEVDALNYSDYYVVDAQGAAGFKTSVTLGSVVGAGDARQGVQGGGFLTGDQTNVTISTDFTSANLSAVNMYGVQWVGLKGGIKFDGSTIGLVISNTFQRSGEVDCGTVGSGAVLLNCTLIDPEGGTAQNYGLKLPSVHNIKNVSLITSGTPATQHMLDLSTSGTYSVSMDNLKFYGTYSGTVLHGDLSSATLSTVTGNALNGANPSAALFSKTGNASSTITINNAVNLTITVLDPNGAAINGAHVTIIRNSDKVDVMPNTTTSNASGIATTTYNYVSDTAVTIRVRKNSSLEFPADPRYFPYQSTGTITINGLILTVNLVLDPIA